MRSLLLTLLCMAALDLCAQQYISFTYDAAGNRIKRELVTGTFRKEGAAADTLPVPDQIGAHKFMIYPNPTTATITVLLEEKENALEKEYALLSLSGTLISSRTTKDTQLRFDLSAQPAGVYLLRIREKDDEVVWRIVKQ
ncbi:MAG TPA: T9SS type A sorting domain-containing protein [Cytophagales bacterium]|nr:T9SS type A sorting domain-containing protein [Cytophagales bacterium]